MGDAHARLRRPRRGARPLSAQAEADPQRSERKAPVRIRDAATLIIVDSSGSVPRILAGRRSSGHVFMAGRVVFPGGRVDPGDLRLAPSHEIAGETLRRLTARTRSGFHDKRAVALPLAAIRETWEETGIMIGRRDAAFASALPVWSEFAAENVAPEPARLVPLARAITPAGNVRRFDTRFFSVSADSIAHRVPLESRPTDEFDRVDWLTIDELATENLHHITRHVLDEAVKRLENGTLFDASTVIPFIRRRGERVRVELL